ncbi:sugar transferase [Methylobacterium sp. B1]|uniref:sugar transferase n=1 Tax=Methylobacterium sp. B1 TaxID=91459 RepID=UPI000686D35B|nr:sugar transferase [Methylobacterium sp. B1]
MSSAENGLLVTSDPGARAGADHTSNIRHGAHVAIDMAVAAAAILLLMPLFMLIAILISLDSPGPIMFRQERTGLNGRRFNIYKFRTMYVQENGPIVLQASRSDARVTRIGKFLRRSSLDELPQLLNVIKCQMAIVGPRPHAVSHDIYYSKIIPNYNSRFHVRPGITGWAQINGSRGATPCATDMEKRVALDLWYVSNAGLMLDVKIVLKTVLMCLVFKLDAY